MREFMKRSLMAFLFCWALAMTSCTKDEMPKGEITSAEQITVTAYVDNNETKVTSEFNSTEKKYTFEWEVNDTFSVVRNGDNKTFTKAEGENQFTGTVVDPDGSGTYYAIHPVTTATDHTAATFDISDQTDDAAYVLYSSTNDISTFKFKHAMAYLRLNLASTIAGATLYVCDITIKTPDGVFTEGAINLENGEINYSNSEKNTITIKNRKLNTPFVIAIPPMSSNNKTLTIWVRFKMSADKDYYSEYTLAGTDGKDIVAGTYYNAELKISNSSSSTTYPYITFAAGKSQTLSYTGSNLQYSTDKSSWKTLGVDPVKFGGDTVLYVRGYLATNTSGSYKNHYGTNGGKFIFGNDVKVSCTGDIRTLIHENYKSNTLVINPNNQWLNPNFKRLFEGCTQLIATPELPATTLWKECYAEMFKGCTNLTKAPVLPATTLTDACYNGMFSGCTNMTVAPALPATTLAQNCYNGMFKGCTGLTTAPELPATTLKFNCYKEMFSGCTSLKTAPELPSTTLAETCYHSMFSGCVNLKTAPELPAATILPEAFGCYHGMFSGCASLTAAPVLSATIMQEGCYANMFEGCVSLSTAPALPATTLALNCYKYMFSGCTSLETAPEVLPATDLPKECYAYMFEKCTSLKTAPEISATSVSVNSCMSMFEGCTELTTGPSQLSAMTLGISCYSAMFRDCKKLTAAPKLPATSLVKDCYIYMFRGCSSLETAPELPAKELVERCYHQMFYNCTNLRYIKALFTNKIDRDNTSYTGSWVFGVLNSSDCIFVMNSVVADYYCSTTGGVRGAVAGPNTIPSNWVTQSISVE